MKCLFLINYMLFITSQKNDRVSLVLVVFVLPVFALRLMTYERFESRVQRARMSTYCMYVTNQLSSLLALFIERNTIFLASTNLPPIYYPRTKPNISSAVAKLYPLNVLLL